MSAGSTSAAGTCSLGDPGVPDPAGVTGARPSRQLDVSGVRREPVEFGVLVPAERLGTTLARLAHELAAAHREVAVLKRENTTLRVRLDGGQGDPRQADGRRRAVAQPAGVAADGSHGNGRGRTIDGTAGDAARERLGQDLHDGVQQRLTALRIRVALAGQRFERRDDREASLVLTDIGDEVDRAIDEVRAFAHGVYPALLTSNGLSAALASVDRRTPESVTIQVSGVGRYPSEIETAVYFSCLAALDNAARHAGSALVTVHVWDHADVLHFTISDTGQGFDPLLAPPGVGITNMHDRIAAVGGTLRIDSTSHGTVVEGNVPYTAQQAVRPGGAATRSKSDAEAAGDRCRMESFADVG
jgi:signal transduction histidine kinase